MYTVFCAFFAPVFRVLFLVANAIVRFFSAGHYGVCESCGRITSAEPIRLPFLRGGRPIPLCDSCVVQTLFWDFREAIVTKEVNAPSDVHGERPLGVVYYRFGDEFQHVVAETLGVTAESPAFHDFWRDEQMFDIVDVLCAAREDGLWHGETLYYLGDWGSYTVTQGEYEDTFSIAAYRGTREAA